MTAVVAGLVGILLGAAAVAAMWLLDRRRARHGAGDRLPVVPDAAIATFEDITDRRAAQAATRQLQAVREVERARFAALVKHSSDLICVINADGTIQYASPAARHMLGFVPGQRANAPMLDFVHPDDRASIMTSFAALLAQPGSVRSAPCRARDVRGKYHHVEVIGTNLLDEPGVSGIVANIRDVTERFEAAERLAWQAFHDPLTGLANRSLLSERLEEAVAERPEGVAVLYIDLDGFKPVNDTYGHETGDRVLVQVAQRLAAAFEGTGTVARLGGDEFVVVLPHLAEQDDVHVMAARASRVLTEPIAVGDATVVIGASIGVAVGVAEPDRLLRNADAALYEAKAQGRGRYVVSSSDEPSSPRADLDSADCRDRGIRA